MIQLKQHMYHYDSRQLQPKFLDFALTPTLSHWEREPHYCPRWDREI